MGYRIKKNSSYFSKHPASPLLKSPFLTGLNSNFKLVLNYQPKKKN